MKNSKNYLFLILVIIVIFVIFLQKKWTDESMKVVFCDVGQGDSILIHQDFFQILIDSGKNERVLGCLGHFLPPWDRQLEIVIMTHGDEDHIGFFGEILGIYDAQMMFFPDSDKDSQTIRGLKEAINQEIPQGASLKQPILGQTIGFPSGGKITFLELPDGLAWEPSENDRSIVFLLEYQGTKWLFTGDLEEKGEQEMLKNGFFPRVDVLKVGHHGSQTSSTMEFLQQTKPSISVISAGANNSFGHPAAAVLENLRQSGSRVLRTDELGDIELRAAANRIWLQSTLQRD